MICGSEAAVGALLVPESRSIRIVETVFFLNK
jgi:hypothetical protein